MKKKREIKRSSVEINSFVLFFFHMNEIYICIIIIQRFKKKTHKYVTNPIRAIHRWANRECVIAFLLFRRVLLLQQKKISTRFYNQSN